jgi:DNA-binding beta-propeller fold protein YncE
MGVVGLGLGLILLASTSTPGQALVPTDLANLGAIGIAFDADHNFLYAVEYGAGTLTRIRLTPVCEVATPPSCDIETVTSGLTHPEDIALDVAHGVGYVTTRDDVGTTGSLWRVNLTSGVKSLVTFNLGAPQQIALDAATGTAYVAAYDAGRVWRIALGSGIKVPVLTGLGHPVGIAVKADRTRIYVSQQDAPGRVSEFDLATHAHLRDVATGLTAPFFLAWTDPANTALWLLERDPVNRLSRIDLPTATSVVVAIAPPGLPARPSAIATNFSGGTAYVTTQSKVVRLALAELPMGEPVFLGVGHIPATDIHGGYATTAKGYFFHVQDAPFGGTLNLFGNLSNFKGQGATHYRVLLAENGGPFAPIARSWNAYLWSPATAHYELAPIAPLPPLLPIPAGAGSGDGFYPIPVEYPDRPERWDPPFLMMRWPSGDNGMITFKVEIWNLSGSTWTDRTSQLPVGNSLTLLIDNTLPDVDLVALRQHDAAAPLAICAIVTSGSPQLDFEITAHDANQHLLSYSIDAYWGHNGYASGIVQAGYPASVDPLGPPHWSGVTNTWHTAPVWMATCNCAHTFILGAWKRTTDGYGYILYKHSSQSLTMNNTGATCP